MKNNSILLNPCSGLSYYGIPEGHLYQVVNSAENKVLGLATKEEACKKYGENCRITDSHLHCPICVAILKKGIEGLQLI